MERINNINCSYTIDKNDCIVELGKNWDYFAVDNQAVESCGSTFVLNNILWDYIQGKEVKSYYKTIVKHVRETIKPITICHRCDSPSLRRFMLLEILPKNNSKIHFNSYVLSLVDREPVKLLETYSKRSQEILKMCSNCKKILSSNSDWEWVEIEKYIDSSNLSNREILPKITYGICSMCYDTTIKELIKIKH